MAAVWCSKMVNLCRFRAFLGQRYMLSRFYFSHSNIVNQRPHLKQRYEGYTRLIAGINMPNALTQSIKVFRRSLVKNAHSKQNKEYRANNAIKAKHVRLIDQEGKNLGIITLKEALEKGRKENYIVVEVGRTSSETVCKLIGQQQLYEKMKEEKKKHVKTSKMKEIKVTGKISEHDLDIKLKKIIEFLEDRDSVKVFVAHRRLQNTSVDDKKALIEKIAEQISDVGSLQGEAKIVGKGVRAIFVPLQRK
jgi:translation initiation factor IF-3